KLVDVLAGQTGPFGQGCLAQVLRDPEPFQWAGPSVRPRPDPTVPFVTPPPPSWRTGSSDQSARRTPRGAWAPPRRPGSAAASGAGAVDGMPRATARMGWPRGRPCRAPYRARAPPRPAVARAAG